MFWPREQIRDGLRNCGISRRHCLADCAGQCAAGVGEQFSTDIRSGHRSRSHAADLRLILASVLLGNVYCLDGGLVSEDSVRFADAVRPEQCKRAGEFVAL